MEYTVIIGDSSYMKEIEDNSIHLIVTSPPYYGTPIWNDFMEEYGIKRKNKFIEFDVFHKWLAPTWMECFRVLIPGGKMVVNCMDIDGKAALYGRWMNSVEIIKTCMELGFVVREDVIWNKFRQHQPPFQGSFPRPFGVLWSNLYEHNIVFQKRGSRSYRGMDRTLIEQSKLTKDDARELLDYNYWKFNSQPGTIDGRRYAPFPEILPRRFIKLLSYIGDTILEPFGGTGTTMKVCRELRRNCVLYEIQERCLPVIVDKCKLNDPDAYGETDTISTVVRE